MLRQLANNWWLVALRGVVGILFGVAALVWPGITLAVLVVLYGSYALVDGVFALVASFRHRSAQWGLLLFEGLLGIGAGVFAFTWPGMTALILVYIVALWAIATGIFEIVSAVRLRKEIAHEWLLALAGVASIALGVLLAANPAVGALSLVWMLGVYGMVFGVSLLVLAFRIRAVAKPSEPEMRGIPHPGTT